MSILQSSQSTTLQALAFVFPGQGSQKAGMLAELAEHFPIVVDTFQEASAAIGFDLWHIAQSGENLDQTQFTQPVLLTSSVAIWRAWLAVGGQKPKLIAGHSLGEYSALVAAEALSLAEAVKLVHLRGQLMQQAVPQGQGAMAAILGLKDEQVSDACAQVSGGEIGNVQPANYNAQGQVVIAGDTLAVQGAIEIVKDMGGKAIVLPISVPSHCSLMKGAADQFAETLSQVNLQLPKIALIHNVNASVAENLDQLRDALVHQLYQSVQWTKTLEYFEQHDVQYLLECGPGNVLSNLAKRLAFVKKVLPTDTDVRFKEARSILAEVEGI